MQITMTQATDRATTEAQSDIQQAVADILSPRIIACVAGVYSDEHSYALRPRDALDVVRITRTCACVIHFPADALHYPSTETAPLDELVASFEYPTNVVPLINTSCARTGHDAINRIRFGLKALHGSPLFKRSPLIKLEILADRQIMVEETLECVRSMPLYWRNRCLPFLPPDPDVVAQARMYNCPCIRVKAGEIGQQVDQQNGFRNPDAVGRAIRSAGNTPVILEGGLNSREDVFKAAQMGASAILFNSAFRLAGDARTKAQELRLAADEAWT